MSTDDTTTNSGIFLTTDQPDYAPDSTAAITATNVALGDTIEFVVSDVDGVAVSGTDQPWTVTDGGAGDLDGLVNGVIETTWSVGEDAAGQSFLLTATDLATLDSTSLAFTDSKPINNTAVLPTSFAYTDATIDLATSSGTTTTVNNVIWANAGTTLDTHVTSSGTGNFGTFVEIQANFTESGFNTTDNSVLNTKNSDQFNTAIHLSDLLAVNANGDTPAIGDTTYYAFKLDLHQSSSKPYISLDDLQLWQSTLGNLGANTFTSGTNPDGSPKFAFNSGEAQQVYDLNGSTEHSVLLNSLFTSGSGGGADLVVLVPTSTFDASKGDFLYLYSAFGYQGGDWSANSTFEEWGALFKSALPPPPPPPTPHATLSVDKETFCVDANGDQHNIGGSVVLAGTNIAWTYTVTATNDAVSNVVITDDNGTPNDPSDDFHPLYISGDTSNPGVLDVGETWTFSKTSTAVVGAYNNDVFVDGTSVQDLTAADEGFSTSGYFGVNPKIDVDKKTNGVDTGLQVLVGQAIIWTYDVTKDAQSNVDLTHVVVHDNQLGDLFLAGDVNHNGILDNGESWVASGDTNNDGVLESGESWHFSATGSAALGPYSNIVTVTADTFYNGQDLTADACGNSLLAQATDTSDYTGHAVAAAGLTKGFWSTHFTLWDVVTGDEKGGSEVNITPVKDWDHDSHTGSDLSALVTKGAASGLGAVNGANNGGGDSGLLLGDLNHDGSPNDSSDLFFDLASAQALANSSVAGDARIILGSQAVAAQLNEYSGFAQYGADTSPNGLISEAVQWLKGAGLLSNGDSKLNFNTGNDLLSPATQAIINDSAGSDYTLSGSAITFKSAAMSSSDSSWTKFAAVFNEMTAGYHPNTGNATVDAMQYTVTADGEGLKNALAAYNHGLDGTTAGFVTSTDGTLIGWQDTAGGTPTDVHANTPDAFWGILEDQNLIHPLGQAGHIAGIDHA